MKNIIQKLFGTTKQAIISTACIMAVIALVGAGTAYAAAKNTAANKTSQVFEATETTTAGDSGVSSAEAITADEAKEIALADAGLTADTVTFTKVELDYDDGVIVYDLEFYAENVEYEYEVNANTGAIYSKSKEAYVTTGSESNTTAAEANTAAGSSDTATSSGTTITSDATESSTTSVTSDTDTASDTESTTGTTSGTTTSAATTTDGTTTSQITLDGAKEIALADAVVSSSDATFTKEKQDYENGVRVYDLEFYTANGEWEYEIRISDGAIVSKSVKEYVSSSGSGTTSDTYISVDEAKEIALNKAGLSASDVTFKKAKLDRDDGIMVYEIEFYYGRTEYEVTINATTGAIVEYEADAD